MGECTDFFAARRSDLRKGGEAAQKAFWEHDLGFLNKAFWFDKMLWDMPRDLESPEADYKFISSGKHSDCERPLTVGALEYVIKNLEDLDRRVLAMPCDPEKDSARYEFKTIGGLESADIRVEMQFLGTPNGVAMMKAVSDILDTRCDIDFVYPWNKDLLKHYGIGTKEIREMLRNVIDKYNALNTDGDWILYKTTG